MSNNYYKLPRASILLHSSFNSSYMDIFVHGIPNFSKAFKSAVPKEFAK